ncbi:hypothetical protein [Erwinia billingiae]|uniref:hypothetical protein n=1 Tax=Erwinia billingiae TaxID=182337 RepID=UPI00224772F5|nr:hypothetical protein [Erwinia billingiae]MCX0500471.1 hypothetical protein [Erwinia billingiae]
MSKMQPGGLAMIISANVSENIGKIVELINFLGPSKSDVSGEVAPAWYVKCESGLLTTEGKIIMRAGIFSRRLMPLSGQDKLHTHLRQVERVNG